MWDDPQMLASYLPPGWKRNNTVKTVTAPNGSIIYFLGADNPESLRGPNPYGIIFDEFDDIKIGIWNEVIRPILAMSGGWAWFMGTYKGQGNLYKFFNKQEPDWESFMLKASESGLFRPEELALARKDLPEATYAQEFECQAVAGGASVFKKIQENIYYDTWELEEDKQYKIGADLAKLNDWTVFTPLDLHTWRVGSIERFNQVDYPMVEAKLEAFWRRYNKAIVTIDSTGIGEPVCDHLEQRGISLERFTFTENTRMQLLQNLAVLLEEGKIKLPNDEQLIKELGAMRYELAGEAKKRVTITSPISDDCVMSLALAVYGLYSPLPFTFRPMKTRAKIGHTAHNPFH